MTLTVLYLSLMASLLLVAASVACVGSAAAPGDTTPAVDRSRLEKLGVEVVYTQPGVMGPLPRDPLWGDQSEDQPIIAELLQALESARRVDGPLDRVPHDRMEFLVIRHSDGSVTRVRRAYDCRRTDSGDYCEPVRNRWVIADTDALESETLQRWWNNMPDYMPYVEWLIVPDLVYYGQPFVLRGQGWHESDYVELRTFPKGRQSEGTLLLDRVPLDHGAFVWEGTLPLTLKPGGYRILAEAGGRRVGKGIKVLESEGPTSRLDNVSAMDSNYRVVGMAYGETEASARKGRSPLLLEG